MAIRTAGRLSAILEADLALLGIESQGVRPKAAIEGPFLFIGSITDNATTAVDLTASAANKSPQLVQAFGAIADPECILAITGFEFYLENTGEADTVGLMADLLENAYIRHAIHNLDDRIGVFPFAGTTFPAAAVADTTTAGAAQIRNRYTRPGTVFELPRPWFVDMSRDTFEVAMLAAVDVAANVPVQVVAHGCAWSTAEGIPDIGVPSGVQDALKSNARRRMYRKMRVTPIVGGR